MPPSRRVVILCMSMVVLAAGCLNSSSPGNETNQTPGGDQTEDPGKPLYYFFYSDGCGACDQMKDTTLSNQTILQALEKNFTYKQIDINKNRELRNRYGVQYIPTNVFAYPNGTVIGGGITFVSEEFYEMLSNGTVIGGAIGGVPPIPFIEWLKIISKFYAENPPVS